MSSGEHPDGPGYFVEGKEVDPQTFEALLRRLEEVPGTWTCSEEAEGGTTRWLGEDEAGARFQVVVVSRPGGNRHSIVSASP